MIGIYTTTKDQFLGGVEIFTEELIELFNENNIKYLLLRKSNLIKCNKLIGEIISTINWIIIKKKQTDIILVNQTSFLEILALPILAIRFKEIYIISHVGSTWYHIRKKLLLKITNYILNNYARKLLLISEDQFDFFTHQHKIRISTVINKAYIKKKCLKNSQNNYILFIGRICKEKGIEDILKVLINLKQMGIILPLIKITGSGENKYKTLINKIIKQNNLENLIMICDPVYDISKKIDLIDNALFLIYPSYADAFPLTVIESFSRNKICLATNIAETKRFINNSDLLFNPGDIKMFQNKIINIINNYSIVNKNAIPIFERAKKYGEGQIIKDIMSVINKN